MVSENRGPKPSDVLQSVLFDTALGEPALSTEEPECFADLGLDLVVASITRDLDQYELAPFFHTPLHDVDDVLYRQAVFHDLEDNDVHEHISTFAEQMRAMRGQFRQANALHDVLQRRFWLLLTHRTYQSAVARLATDLGGDDLHSDALLGLRDHVRAYVDGDSFQTLLNERRAVHDALKGVRYCVQINGSKVTITPYENEPDYGAEVEATFAKFQQGDVRSHLVTYNDYLEMNHVEAQILALVAELNPDAFGALNRYVTNYANFLDPVIARFDREIQFYLSVRGYLHRLTSHDLPVCYPTVSRTKHVHATNTYDIALAHKQIADGQRLVTNDFSLDGDERVIVVTGANQGGKTTFSRTFGQLHYLAALGCPVPGRDAELFLADHIYTHYEKEEDIHGFSGKLEDELVRIHQILTRASSDSIVIMNEIFTSTSLDDAIELGTAVLHQIIDRDIVCVCVTFVDELSTLSDTTVSMVASVEPDDPAVRTFKLERRAADGLAHAVAIAEKYGLTFDRLCQRIPS